MLRVALLLLATTLFVVAKDKELKTTQGYAQYKQEACELSMKRALKFGSEEDIVSRCSCYKQDGNDWLCYTTVKPTK